MASDEKYGRPSDDVLTASQNSRNLSTEPDAFSPSAATQALDI
jgi:hypothetical protein